MPRGSRPGERRGGRQKGTPNKVTADVRQAEAQLAMAAKERADWLFGGDYWDKLKERIANGTAPHMETLFQHYRHGKPKDTIEHQIPMRPVVIDQLQPGELTKKDGDDG